MATSDGRPSTDELHLASREYAGGERQVELSVPKLHCAVCISAVEECLTKLDDVTYCRANLTLKRVSVRWQNQSRTAPDLIGALQSIGFASHPVPVEAADEDRELSVLLRALAVAGFFAMNIMLLSVSIWAGADPQTRSLFHWISAILALPVLLYSGRIFFGSAWSALRHGRSNMDVPISVGVILAYAMSLYDTYSNAPHAYFDATTSLLFFLLVGRTLDHVMRQRARSAVTGLARLLPAGATICDENERLRVVPIEEIGCGSVIAVSPGERIPVDGIIRKGHSEIDRSIVTGEQASTGAQPGEKVQAGVLNLTQPLIITATASAHDSFIQEMVRMVEIAENGRMHYRRVADRAAAIYSPAVHLIALGAYAGWYLASGDWHASLSIAIAVLIITCPCALGLAAPIVQIVAARRMHEHGIMVRDGSAMERLARVDTVVFDKTGTLTLGHPKLTNRGTVKPEQFLIAAAISEHSRHPLSLALQAQAPAVDRELPEIRQVEEIPGCGLEAFTSHGVYRLGRPQWAGDVEFNETELPASSVSSLVSNGICLARFAFEHSTRPDAAETVARLQQKGMTISVLSGDRMAVVDGLADRLAIVDRHAELLPADKLTYLKKMQQDGHNILMIGDGINDAPAMAAADVSMAPANAADLGRNTADFVFLHESLNAVTITMDIARRTASLVRQNFAFAIGYNAVAVPIALTGYVTPLIAAIAMSLSSLIVVLNALRLQVPGKITSRSESGPSSNMVTPTASMQT